MADEVVDAATGMNVLFGGEPPARRPLLEDDASEPTPKEHMALRAALAGLVEKIAAGELKGDAAVTALVEAMEDPDSVNMAVQESEYRAKQRDQAARERSARSLLESVAKGTGIRIGREQVLRVARVARSGNEIARELAAIEIVANEKARLAKLRRPTPSVVGVSDALNVLHAGG